MSWPYYLTESDFSHSLSLGRTPPTLDKPAFKAEARTLLKGEDLFVDEECGTTLKTRREEVDKATRLAKSWKGWKERIKAADTSMGKIDKNTAGAPGIVRNWVVQAQFELRQAEDRLARAKNLDEIEETGAVQALVRAEDIVAGLRRFEEEEWPVVLIEGVRPPEVPSFTIAIRPLFAVPGILPEEDAPRLRVIRRALRHNNLLMVGLALGAGLLTGLNELYFGKTFGTALDYATAFAWGFGTKATVEVILAAVNRPVRVAD